MHNLTKHDKQTYENLFVMKSATDCMHFEMGYSHFNADIGFLFQNYNMGDLDIAAQFKIQGKPIRIESFGSGHINDTYRVHTDSKMGPGYVLQKINHGIFKDIPLLMHNIVSVSNHLSQKYAAMGLNPEQHVLQVVPSVQGGYYYQSQEAYWRMYLYIPETRSYDRLSNPQQAREGGRAFGQFQAMLADLDPHTLGEVLPYFCHIGYRLNNFHAALQSDTLGRKKGVETEITFLEQRAMAMRRILEMGAVGDLPLRITHNDTKFNNVLLDLQDRAQCVVDLDTVMPGYVAYDFGDAIRTIINQGTEDATDLHTIRLNIPAFKAYTEGYLEHAHTFLTAQEVDSLMEGVLLFPYMQALRFMTDYLLGDTYYKVKHPQHNLQRTRAQIRLLEEIEAHQQELQAIITSLTKPYGF